MCVNYFIINMLFYVDIYVKIISKKILTLLCHFCFNSMLIFLDHVLQLLFFII